jgi:hypothetical protein
MITLLFDAECCWLWYKFAKDKCDEVCLQSAFWALFLGNVLYSLSIQYKLMKSSKCRRAAAVYDLNLQNWLIHLVWLIHLFIYLVLWSESAELMQPSLRKLFYVISKVTSLFLQSYYHDYWCIYFIYFVDACFMDVIIYRCKPNTWLN